MKQTLKQLSRFLLSSVVGFFINLAILYIFTEFFRVYYIASAIIGFMVSHLYSFGFNRRVTFKSKGKIHIQWSKFFFANIFALVINIPILYILTEYLGIYYLLSQIIASIITFFINFLLSKHWAFKD